ncbi:MAG: ROK family transcriptional regulator [Actinobacteria bacterium]|nr:ROK family transcriptional regulator [Actinomycetota bacterium]MCL6087909.1 ROK family transcriptional regulator [Actinomycetota bacterium]
MNLIGKPELVRKINRQLVLKYIRQEQVLTKTDLYELTGLSKVTINEIVDLLLKKGLVIKSGYGNSGKEGGKRPLLIKFNPSAYYTIGVLIGEHKIRCGITDLNGKIIHENNIDTEINKGPKDVIKRLIKLINETMNSNIYEKKKLLGIGVGLPGIIDFDNGIIRIFTRFHEWKDIPLREIIQNEFDVPVALDNEVSVRALGEKWFGIAKKVNNFITIATTAEGIGAGVIINREIFRGKNFLCGEIGHMILDINIDSDNNYEKFNFENLVSEKNINNIIKENISKFDTSNLEIFKIYKNNNYISLEDLFFALNKNQDEDFSKFILKKIIRLFAIGIANTICAFDPDLIIIHGKFALFDDFFFEEVRKFINNNIFQNIKKEINIQKSIKSKEMGIVGAASMILDIIPI